MTPRFSVLMPTHDRPHLIGHAIRSVLAQSRADLELLVVGDGAVDGTAAVVQGFGDPRIRWFDLPKGATLLASTDRYAQQAFSYEGAGLAVQFHPEVTAKGLEAWFVGHCCEIGALRGTDVKALRAAAQRHAPALLRQGKLFFEAWLDAAGLG